jgi:CTP synthase
VAGWSDANSSEFDANSEHCVVGLITEWKDESGQIEQRSESSDLGGTMRLGAQQCRLELGSLAHQAYKQEIITERHRHRYEVNNTFIGQLEAAGLKVSGRSMDGSLVEMVEIEDHPWFVACQFHPEFTSTPRAGHGLFEGFVDAAVIQAEK